MHSFVRQFADQLLPDPIYLWIRFRLHHGYFPNIFFPKTFNEKILAKILFDRAPRLEIVADKLRAREYISSRVGEQYLPKIYEIWENASSIRLDPHWNSVVLKANHGSGFVKIIPNVMKADLAEIQALGDEWLHTDFGRIHKEWCYLSTKPTLFAEELLGDGQADSLVDYKLFCFSGKPYFIKVIKGMVGTPHSFYADLMWNNLNVSDGQLPLNIDDNIKPPNFDKMLDLAHQLSTDFDMVRVDMYNINGKIYIGELTNYPLGAVLKISPQERDIYLGQYWRRKSMSYLPFAQIFQHF